MTSSQKLTTTVSTKGQVILPKAIRQRFNWDSGTRLTVEDTADGVLLKAMTVFPPTTAEEVFGSLHYEGLPKTLEEMEGAIALGVKRRHAVNRY